MKHPLIISAVALSLVTVAAHAGPRPDETITADRLRFHLEFIAHDLLEGRNTPSRGLDIASIYIRSMLKQWGVRPGGPDGSYFQTFNIERTTIIAEGSKLEVGGKSHTYGDGFYAQNGGSPTTGSLVYVGYGYKVPSAKIDPYAGLDVKGKWLVVTAGRPNFGAPGAMRAPDTRRPEDVALESGAAGVITISNSNATQWQNRVAQSTAQGRPTIARPTPRLVNQITINTEIATQIFADEKVALNDLVKDGIAAPSFALSPTTTLSATINVDRNKEVTQNVVGLIEGTDPKLKSEYVAVSAHYDHVGTRATGEDKIYNGADDDGSGTVAVLELARAFALGPKPKRSMLFIWHAGEERGLWGSAYMRDNPVIPLDQLTALINIDMIGRSRLATDTNPANSRLSGPNEIYLVGSRKISNDLGDIIVRANNARYKLAINYKYDAPNDPENIYARSDHYNYAQKGVPIAFFYDGTHEDYHGVGDEVDKIDFAKMEMVTRTIHTALWDLASRKSRPRPNPK